MYLRGFFDFVREQGVVGLAVGFLIGGSITALINAFVGDIVNPVIGIFIGINELRGATWTVGNSVIKWGSFAAALINFLIIAAVVYFGVKGLGLDRIDRKKEKQLP